MVEKYTWQMYIFSLTIEYDVLGKLWQGDINPLCSGEIRGRRKGLSQESPISHSLVAQECHFKVNWSDDTKLHSI